MNGWLRIVRGAILVSVGVCSSACISQYRPPSVEQPHAIVKFRRRYEQRPGTSLVERLLVNGDRAFEKVDKPAHAAEPRTDALLVHPATVPIEMLATFSHYESYLATESYACGTRNSLRTCSRSVTKQRTVVDGRCVKEMSVRFDAGKVYLFELDYQDRRNCHMRCMVQRPLGDGKFENSACPMEVL